MFLRSAGGFDQTTAVRKPLGNGASDLLATNLDNATGVDALVTNRADGTVSIFTGGFTNATATGAVPYQFRTHRCRCFRRHRLAINSANVRSSGIGRGGRF